MLMVDGSHVYTGDAVLIDSAVVSMSGHSLAGAVIFAFQLHARAGKHFSKETVTSSIW